MFKLRLTAKAKRELKLVTKFYEQEAIKNAFKEIKENPFVGKPLTRELTGRFTYRVGVYRIIYTVNKNDKSFKSSLQDIVQRSTVSRFHKS